MIKNITAEEIKTTYRDNHGFAFVSAQPVSDDAIYRLADSLIQFNIATKHPIVVTRYQQGVVFIYDDFDAPKFFAKAQFAEHVLGICKIVPFLEYVR
jgi:hypothetical protein